MMMLGLYQSWKCSFVQTLHQGVNIFVGLLISLVRRLDCAQE